MTALRILFSVVFFFPILCNSQQEDGNYIVFKPKSIALKFMGAPTYPLGLAYGEMINDRVSVEVGAGFNSFGAGAEVYLRNPRKHRLNLNTGFFFSYNFDGFPMCYLPLGISYLGKKNFQYGLNVGILYSKDVTLVAKDFRFWPWFGLSVAKRFGVDKRADHSRVLREADDPVLFTKNEPRIVRNILSVRIGFLFPFLGFNYERLLTAKIGIEGSVGFLGASLGTNIYLTGLKPKKLNFKIGIMQGFNVNFFDGIEWMTYVPIGLNYLTSRNTLLGADAGIQYWYGQKQIYPGFSFKIGKAF